MAKQVEINGNNYDVYATVEDADSYFAATFGSVWDDIGSIQKSQLLVTATRLIDRREYMGVKVDENQPLLFPRYIFDKVLTSDDLLMRTCIELAMCVYLDGGQNVDISNIKSVNLGDASITFKDNSTVTEGKSDLIIDKFLSPYLIGGVRVVL